MFSSTTLKLLLVSALVLVSLVTGCISGQENRQDVTTEVTPIAEVPTPVETETVAPSTMHPTRTATNTATPSPTKTAVPPTNTPSITPTISPAPTLSVQEEGELLSMLLTQNAGCNLPCWWGITPGEISAQEARDIFASQGIDDWEISFDGTYALMGLGYPRADGFHSHHVLVQFDLKGDIVQVIGVDGGYRTEELRPLFIRDWQSYSPSAILNHYGLPDYIELVPVENSPYYRLELAYELLGIEIKYIAPFELLESGAREICFDVENIDYIYLILYPPAQANTVPYEIIPNRPDAYVSWESTTGLDKDAFWDLFTNVNPPCVEIN